MKKDKLRLLRSRDKDTFEMLVRENQENVYRIVFSVVNHEQDAQDLAQEVFIKIYMSISSFRGNAALSTWIYKIAYNTAVDYCKKLNRRPAVRSIDSDDDPEIIYLRSARSADPQDRFSEAEIRRDIAEALAMLPDEQRQMVMLKDVYGFSYEQIALMTGIKAGTLKSRLSRGRSGVKNILVKKWNNPYQKGV